MMRLLFRHAWTVKAVFWVNGQARALPGRVRRGWPLFLRFYAVSLVVYVVTVFVNLVFGDPFALWGTVLTFPIWWLLGYIVGSGVVDAKHTRWLRQFATELDDIVHGCPLCGCRRERPDRATVGRWLAFHREFECPAFACPECDNRAGKLYTAAETGGPFIAECSDTPGCASQWNPILWRPS